MRHKYENLECWKKSMNLAKKIYQIVHKFPDEERDGLAFELIDSMVKVPSNIIGGSQEDSKIDFLDHIYTSIGKLNRVESTLILSKNLGYINEEEFKDLENSIEETQRVLNGFRRYLEKETENSTELPRRLKDLMEDEDLPDHDEYKRYPGFDYY